MRPTGGFVYWVAPQTTEVTSMPQLLLSPRERQLLRARAHVLRPVVLLGAAGLSDKVMHEIDRALAAHELIKIKVPADAREVRAQIFDDIAEKLNAAKIQSIGKTIVLFRPEAASGEKEDAGGSMIHGDDERRGARAPSKRTKR